MAEKQLLQTRLKSINSLLDNNAKQLELTRSKIASILTPLNYQECHDFIDKIKENRVEKVRERQVRKLNNLINKKEGGIIWQSSQVPPAARAFPRANNRQAGRLIHNASPQVSQSSPGERALLHSHFSQAGRSQASLEDNTPSPVRSALSQAGSSQASLVDITLSPARSVLFQAGSSQASPVDSTLSLAKSVLSQEGSSPASPAESTPARNALSQAGSLQVSPGDSTLTLAESALSQSGSSQAGSSQASPEDSTLSPAESVLSQAGNSQASPEENTPSPAESELSQGSFPSSLGIALSRQRLLYLLKQSGTWQGLGLGRQATPPGRSARSLSETEAVPQGVLPQDNASQEAGSFPSRHHTLQGSSPLEEPNPKWVINLSSKPLSPAQRSVLAKDPNFVVTPRHPPNLEYITAIEAACTKLS